LGAQFFGVAWLLLQSANLLNSTKIRVISSIIASAANALALFPVFMRGWQNRSDSDIDGMFVILGAPMEVAGDLFMPQFTKKSFF
jgi:hypothetical protein